METNYSSLPFCIIDGPSLDTLLEALKRGTTNEMKSTPYFLVKRGEYVQRANAPHSVPRIRPIEEADEKRLNVRNVQSIKRLEGNFLYDVECLLDESIEPVTFHYIVHGRIGDFSLNPEDAGVLVFLTQN